MNKADLVNEVARVVSTKKEAQAAVDCVLEAIIKILKEKGADSFGLFLSQSKTKIPSPRQP
jgi:nucleoid DNA-binding protein